jgi:hypothetical protein
LSAPNELLAQDRRLARNNRVLLKLSCLTNRKTYNQRAVIRSLDSRQTFDAFTLLDFSKTMPFKVESSK